MKKAVKISSIFPKYLFCDMDYESLDFQRDKDIVIPRALYFTNKNTFENDIRKLESFYSSSQILAQLKTSKELISNEVCRLVAGRYSVPYFTDF